MKNTGISDNSAQGLGVAVGSNGIGPNANSIVTVHTDSDSSDQNNTRDLLSDTDDQLDISNILHGIHTTPKTEANSKMSKESSTESSAISSLSSHIETSPTYNIT